MIYIITTLLFIPIVLKRLNSIFVNIKQKNNSKLKADVFILILIVLVYIGIILAMKYFK